MDQVNRDQMKLQRADKLNKHQFFKRTLQLLISVSVFSFFLWYSSGFSILPQSFNAYLSTFLFSMFTHTLERKYMFLICNGILAFLAKSSLSSSKSISALNLGFQASNLSDTKALPSSEVVVPLPLGIFESSEDAHFMPEEQPEQESKQEDDYEEKPEAEEDGRLHNEFEGGEKEVCSFNAKEDDGGKLGRGVMVVTKGDDEADTNMATNEELADTDELNRKFEEFIRKTKEKIRIEAQRQLTIV